MNWISVIKENPPHKETVLVWFFEDELDNEWCVGVGHLDNIWDIYRQEELTQLDKVTHWMPLPKTPKEIK